MTCITVALTVLADVAMLVALWAVFMACRRLQQCVDRAKARR